MSFNYASLLHVLLLPFLLFNSPRLDRRLDNDLITSARRADVSLLARPTHACTCSCKFPGNQGRGQSSLFKIYKITTLSRLCRYTDLTYPLLTLWRLLLLYGTAIKHHVADWVKSLFVFLTSSTLTLSPERQSARISKITNDSLTRSAGTGCFSCTYMATVGIKGLNDENSASTSNRAANSSS